MANDSELLPDERRLLSVNRHPLVLVGRSYLVVGLGLIVIAVGARLPLSGSLRDLRWFAALLVALVIFIFVDVQYIRWRAESYTITDQRDVVFLAFAPEYRVSAKLALLSEMYWRNSAEPADPNRFAGDVGFTLEL